MNAMISKIKNLQFYRRLILLLPGLCVASLSYQVLRVLIRWWTNVRYLKTQANIIPLASELSSTPLSLALSFGKNATRMNHFRLDILKKYTRDLRGPFQSISGCGVLFGFQPLIISIDPVIIKHILKDKFNNYIKLQSGMDEFMGNNLLTASHGPNAPDKGKFYKYQRRVASQLFTEKKLNTFLVTAVTYNTEKLVKELKQYLDTSATDGFPLKESIFTLAFDSMCEVAFGYRNDSGHKDLRYQEAFDGVLRLMPLCVFDPTWKLPFSSKYVPTKMKMVRYNNTVSEFFYQAIDSRKSEDSTTLAGRSDLLSMFLAVNTENKYTRKELRDLLFLFVAAGKDTSSSTLHWLIYHLCLEPELQEQLFHETVGAVKFDDVSGKISVDVPKLKENLFLDGLVCEVLRLYPAFALNGKLAANDDVLPNGMIIKKGTNVLFDAYAMGQNPTIYPEPEKFLPSRWMTGGRKSEEIDQYTFPVFSGGNRICIGKNMALRQIKVILVSLIHRFKFKLNKEELNALSNREVLYDDSSVMGYACDLLVDMTER